MGKKLGTAGRVMKRKELKKTRPLSDEALLRSAQKAADKWQATLRKQQNI